jgi:hypothetical protein
MFVFKRIMFTFATPIMGTECLIKYFYCEHFKLQDYFSQ